MTIPLTAIPVALSALQGVGQIVGGIFGRNKAKKEYENAVAPNYLDSQAYKTAQTTANLAGRYAEEGLPEQSMRFQQDMIGRSGAAALGTLSSLRQGVVGVGGVAQGLSDQYRQLASMDANQRISNRSQYFQQMQNLQGQQQVQAERDYGLFLNQQAARLAQMTQGSGNINQGNQSLSQGLGMATMLGMTPEILGGWKR